MCHVYSGLQSAVIFPYHWNTVQSSFPEVDFPRFPPVYFHKLKPVETAMDYFDVFEIISLIFFDLEVMVQTAISWKFGFDHNMSIW